MSLMAAVLPIATVALVLCRAVRISPSPGSKVGSVLAMFAGIAPAVWAVSARDVPLKIVLGYGALFFAGSVLLKWVITLAVLSKHVYPRLPPPVAGVMQGVLSSACEMGVALLALAFVLPGLALWQVFGFGAGAAALEVLIVSMMENPHQGTGIGEYVESQFTKLHKGPAWLAAAVPFVERAIATTDHIACRGLIAAGLASGRVWPAALAFLAFAATDGFAGYCLGRKWEFSQPAVAARLYGVLALVAAGSAVAWGVSM